MIILRLPDTHTKLKGQMGKGHFSSHLTMHILIFHFIPSTLWLRNSPAFRRHAEMLFGKKLLLLQEHIYREVSLFSAAPSKIPPKSPLFSTFAEASMYRYFLKDVLPLL